MILSIIFLAYLEVSKKKKLIVCGLCVNIAKYDTDHRQAVLFCVRESTRHRKQAHLALTTIIYSTR
jgi:hypothetical protein